MQNRTFGYYSKMLLACIVAVVAISFTAFFISSSIIKEQERSEFLRSYDMAVNELSTVVSSKQNAMSNTLGPVFSSVSRYQNLCNLYRGEVALDSDSHYAIVQMLSEISQYDQYCLGVLLRTGNGRLYQYSSVRDTLTPIVSSPTDVRFTPYEPQILTDSQLASLSSALDKPSEHIFGLCSTIFDYMGTNMLPIGQLILLYGTSEFTNIITNSGLNEEAHFILTNADDHIIYSSDDNYDALPPITIPAPEELDNVEAQTKPVKVNGTDYYHSWNYNHLYNYYSGYYLPTSIIAQSPTQYLLGILTLFICISAITLYVITLRQSQRKLVTILSGMSLVGQNNLDYRLPVPKSNDEFTAIINSFNGMCDELKQNVEKAYLYEISQKQAELYAMQTSINPHFLYNTLEQIRVQIMKGDYAGSSQMLLLLSKMYRNQTRRNLYVSIGEELSLCENLINLYMYRYGNFDYEFIVENSLKIYGIPKNTLQPLVENYFAHGYVPDRDDNFFTITVANSSLQEGHLEISVEDNGSSITPEELELLEEKLAQPIMDRQEDNGFALSNVNSRLKIVFGPEARLYPGIAKDGKGFAISFTIPAMLPQDLVDHAKG